MTRQQKNKFYLGGEGRGHGRLRLRQRDSDMGGLEGTAVIGTIATHGSPIAEADQPLDQLGLLVGAHARVNAPVDQDPLECVREELGDYGE